MQPQQPMYGQNSGYQDPYGFILNPQKPQRGGSFSGLPGMQDSFFRKIIVLVGATVLIIILLVIGSSIFLNKGVNTQELISIAQTQNELARVADLGAQQASSQSIKGLAVNINLSLASDQQSLVSFLGSVSKKPNAKLLAATQNAQTDEQLSSATQTSTFDATFKQIITTKLTDYETSLKQAYTHTKSKTLQTTLSKYYQNAELLLQQANTTTP